MTTSQQLSQAAKQGYVPPSLADKAADELDTLKELLKKVEWNVDGDCSYCGGAAHTPECPLQKALHEP